MAPVSRPEPTLSASHVDGLADNMETNKVTSLAAYAIPMHVLPDDQYSKTAQAVAALFSPTITSAIDKAIAACISQLRKEL